MTLRIYAHQKYGKKTARVVEDFEFCCWNALYKWMQKFVKLHKCEECLKEDIHDSQVRGKR